MNKSEALIRALWMVDNHLLDKHIEANDVQLGILSRMETYQFKDERVARDQVAHVFQSPMTLMANCKQLNSTIFELHQGLPVIQFGLQSQTLCRIVDPDSLVCLHEDLCLPHGELYNWAAIPIRDGHISNSVLNHGSVDTHIHLGGTLPPLFYWLILMGGEVPINVVSDFAKKRRGYADAQQWRSVIAKAMWTRLSLAHKIQEITANRAFPYLPGFESQTWARFIDLPKKPLAFAETRDIIADFNGKQHRYIDMNDRYWPFQEPLRIDCRSTEPCHYAQGERRLLVFLGHYLRTAPANDPIEALLLSYLRAKNAFHQLLIHDYGSEGLMRFMENFSRRGFYFGPKQQRKRQGRVLLKLERARMAAALDSQMNEAFMFEKQKDSHLMPTRRIEMRVSLAENKRCLRTFHAWLSGVKQHVTARNAKSVIIPERIPPTFSYPTQVGLIFHLIKYPAKPGQTEALRAENAWHTARKLTGILNTYAGLRAFVVGLDVAGDERNSPPRLFVKAYSQLRSAQQHLRPLAQQLPIQLGWTYHVGEDYADIVTALRHIDEVCCLLFANDAGRLGHALALAESSERFYQRRHYNVELAIGEHILDLVWARGRLSEACAIAHLSWLDARIAQLLNKPCQEPHVMQCYQQMGLGTYKAQLLEHELLAFLGFEGDSKAIVTLEADKKWLSLSNQLQCLLRKRLAFLGLCIESNPSSNLIIGGYSNYRELPYQTLVNDGLAVSLNTDDPGLFISSLPGEFSAMYKALAEQNFMGHRDILNWLDARLTDAQQSSFLGNHVPIGLTSLQGIFKHTAK